MYAARKTAAPAKTAAASSYPQIRSKDGTAPSAAKATAATSSAVSWNAVCGLAKRPTPKGTEHFYAVIPGETRM